MQQYHPAGIPYRHTLDAFLAVYREGVRGSASGTSSAAGVKALWRGVDVTTYRGIVVSASQIAAYDQFKQTFKKRGILQEGIGLHMAASMLAGFVSSATSNPIGQFRFVSFRLTWAILHHGGKLEVRSDECFTLSDVIKVRIHNDKERRYRGVVHCMRVTAREGPLAFYKGFGMCWARVSACIQ
jgi:hypothetical protein